MVIKHRQKWLPYEFLKKTRERMERIIRLSFFVADAFYAKSKINQGVFDNSLVPNFSVNFVLG